MTIKKSLEKITTASAAQIHAGEKGIAGRTLITLLPPTKGMSKDCVSLEPDQLGVLIKNQSHYYVSVQNAEFPNGAIRGQLR